MFEPLVSVIIPTYNRSSMIWKGIESVLAQQYPHFELIVVDDGSTDDTRSLVARYAEGATNTVRYIYQENKKQAVARNTGILNSLGELIAFLDDDDLWDERKLALQVPLFQNPEVGLVYSGAQEVDLQGKFLWTKGLEHFQRGRIFDQLLFNHFITASSVVVRRSCLATAGLFNESLAGAEDIHMWLKICHDYAVDFIPEVLVSCRNHEGNVKKNSDTMFDNRYRMWLDIFRHYGLNNTARSAWLNVNADYQFFLGYRMRKRQKGRALACYLHSMRYRVRAIQVKAIIKLFIPGYYLLADRFSDGSRQ